MSTAGLESSWNRPPDWNPHDPAEINLSDVREHWALIQRRLEKAERLCVLTDFDGTLIPLQDHPERASLPPRMREVLEHLARKANTGVGIVSGRALSDLVARCRVRSIWYVGNHGFEIMNPKGRVKWSYDQADVQLLGELHEIAIRELSRVDGVYLENKGPILALHLRRVMPVLHTEITRMFSGIVARFSPRLVLFRGHETLEARIRKDCNKGMAVRYIGSHLPPNALMFYFGDDLSDRDAFREVGTAGVTVNVGPPVDEAEYTLPDVAAVAEVLQRLIGEAERLDKSVPGS